MKSILRVTPLIFFFFVTIAAPAFETKAGFFLPDNVSEVTFKFQNIRDLVVLPVTINDSIKVNLILDTGCRNLVLFGKKFQKLFQTQPDQHVQFSGLGTGSPIHGKLSLNTKVSIHAVIGEQIPVVIVPQQNLFSAYPNVHGVIGYDILIKFEIEIDPVRKFITFRPAASAELSSDFQKIPLSIHDSRPLIQSQVFFSANEGLLCALMLDTGSSLWLLMKTTDLKKFPAGKNKVLGRGFNGNVMGIQAMA